MITCSRIHDFCAGHRVVGHEHKCRFVHGHNYRALFECAPEEGLDALGRVVDFGVIKSQLCNWLEAEWDHKLLLWEQDPLLPVLQEAQGEGVVALPFNPTAENMAEYLLKVVGPERLKGSGAKLVAVTLDETRKCSARAVL